MTGPPPRVPSAERLTVRPLAVDDLALLALQDERDRHDLERFWREVGGTPLLLGLLRATLA